MKDVLVVKTVQMGIPLMPTKMVASVGEDGEGDEYLDCHFG